MKGKSFLSFSLVLALAAMLAAAMLPGCKAAREKGQEVKEKVEEVTEQVTGKKPEGEPIVLGAVFSVTGKAAFLGEPEKKTIEMLVEKVNNEGGIDGRPLEIIVLDDAGEDQKTIDAFNKLVDENEVLAVIGPSRSGNTMAIKEMANEKEIPLVSCAAAEAIISPVEESKWVFKTPQKDSDVAQHILNHMESKGIKKIAVLYGGTPFGQFGLDQIKKFSADAGIKVIEEEKYAPTDTEEDLKVLLTNVKKNADVEAVVNWSILPAQTSVPKLMKEMEIDLPLYHSHGFGNIKWAREAGAAADDVMFPAGRLLVAEELDDSDPQKANLVEYKNDYESTYEGEDVSTFGGHAYDAFWLLVNAIKEVGTDKAAIRDALENSEFSGTGGNFKMTPEDHVGLGMDALSMLIVKNGKFTLLED